MKKILAICFFCMSIFPVVQAQLTAPPIPGRPDNLTQAQVDQLLANGQMNFDGLRFEGKRMEFINFDKGSFRGTTFYNTILNDGVARRKTAVPDRFDFEEANIYLSKLKRVHFSYWKFDKTTFQADSITDATFKYCSFTDSKMYNSYFIKVGFNNGLKNPFNNLQLFNCILEGTRFDSIKFNGGAFAADVNFKSCIFFETEFFNIAFLKPGPQQVKFSAGCFLQNVKFTSSNLDGVILGDAPSGTWLAGVSFDNTTWRNGSTNASYNENCIFKGSATALQNINFTSSVFNGINFGLQNANYKIPIKQCQFNNCVFNSPVTFYNCNLENSTFPPITVLQAAGVRFIGCLNAPYNN